MRETVPVEKLWWRTQSHANQSPCANFPANREKNREFSRSAGSPRLETLNSGVATGFRMQIPYQKYREFFSRNKESRSGNWESYRANIQIISELFRCHSAPLAMSALPPKADMCGATSDVCYGPKADIRSAKTKIAVGLRSSLGDVAWTRRMHVINSCPE
jgi:hypothetical protein